MFLKKIITFSIILILLDIGVGFVFKILFENQIRGTNYRTQQTIQSIKHKIIILGSSRASHHYNPYVFQINGLESVYNAGRDGTLFEYSLACTQSILKRNHPEKIIVDLNLEDFYINQKHNEKLQSLIPFYKSNPELRGLITEVRGSLEPWKQISSIYPYNSTIINSISNIIRAPSFQDTSGYQPLDGQMSFVKLDTLDFQKSEFNYFRIKLLKQLVDLCNNNKVELIIVQSPRYAIYINHKIENILKKIISDNGCYYYSFANDTTFVNNPNLFKDQSHLNNNGADYFTKIFIEKRKNLNE